MINTRLTFETRKEELILFLNNIECMENTPTRVIDFYNILHANTFLMMYNMVESTVMGGILEIYDAVKTQELSYKKISTKIQDVWFEFKFNEVYDKNAHHTSYKKKAYEIINNILKEKKIDLNRKAVNISGNLDANIIRRICDEHGINFNTPEESKGGYKIANVRDLRNDLAHGLKSFVECGRNYTISDLKSISNEIISFLDGLINGMTKYYENNEWILRKTEQE